MKEERLERVLPVAPAIEGALGVLLGQRLTVFWGFRFR